LAGGFTVEDGSCCGDGVDGVGFAVAASGLTVGADHFDHGEVMVGEVPGESFAP
jgi:hypothetical protein